MSFRRIILAVAVLAVILALASVATPRLQAQTFAVLYTFTGGTDGGMPYAGLARDSAGNFYGTTQQGGDLSCNAPYGCGTVFKLDAAGNETVLHAFAGGTDGRDPWAGVIRDATGNLYGTTGAGGDTSCFESEGCGTVFKLDASGNKTVLYSFKGAPDGSNPWAGVIRDTAGNFYGTTYAGGDPSCELVAPTLGCGTVFKLDASGKETLLYTFTNGADGALVTGGLIRGATGNLYGTTLQGGDLSCHPGSEPGCGTVFKLDMAGAERTIYAFTGMPDGRVPTGGVVFGEGHNLYGTTEGDGESGGGTIFKVNDKGEETVLHSFTFLTDGGTPSAGLIIDAAGNLYGTTLLGGGTGCGDSGCGTVFKLTP